jgi:hypothetical protein
MVRNDKVNVCSVVTPFVIKLHKTSGIKAQYCNLIQQPRFIINFKDYKPNKFPFGSKWTMFYQLPLPALPLTGVHHSQARLFIVFIAIFQKVVFYPLVIFHVRMSYRKLKYSISLIFTLQMSEDAVVNWDSIIHKNVRSKDGQDAGNVDAIEGDTVVITSEGDRQEYNVPKSEIEGYNGAEVSLKITFGELNKYKV